MDGQQRPINNEQTIFFFLLWQTVLTDRNEIHFEIEILRLVLMPRHTMVSTFSCNWPDSLEQVKFVHYKLKIFHFKSVVWSSVWAKLCHFSDVFTVCFFYYQEFTLIKIIDNVHMLEWPRIKNCDVSKEETMFKYLNKNLASWSKK